jgi:dienelactone hydrolase
MQTDWSNNTGLTSAMLNNPPPKPPAKCAIPALGMGFRCFGDSAGQQPAESPDQCCGICQATAGCSTFSWQVSSRTCFLWKNCPEKPADENFITGWTPPADWESAHRFRVGRAFFSLPGYQCGGTGNTVMFYPLTSGANRRGFNVVVYGHGAWGEVDGSDPWLEMVASLGLIVIAPFQGMDMSRCGSLFADDMLNALEQAKLQGEQLHPALATADFSRTGIMGHSKGAKYAPLAASTGRHSHGVAAVVVSCDTPKKHPAHEVPTMYVTGSLDKFDEHNSLERFFKESAARPKVYAKLKDAYHMEVQEGMRLNVLTARFLSCHVGSNPDDCEVIYGTGEDSMCQANAYTKCSVVPDMAPEQQAAGGDQTAVLI